MKKLTNFERKHLLLGLLLMFGSIVFYVYCTKGVDAIDVFKLFFPTFWGLYTVVSIAYIMLTGWLAYRKTEEKEQENSNEEIEAEIYKRRFLLITNILTAVTLVVGYVSSTFRGISIQFETYQPLVWTLAICVEMAMYVIYLFKEDKPEPAITEESTEHKTEGVQLVSYEEAMHILEEYGYEIEGQVNIEENISEESKENNDISKEESIEAKEDEKFPVVEEKDEVSNESTLPAVRETKFTKSKSRIPHKQYRTRKRD